MQQLIFLLLPIFILFNACKDNFTPLDSKIEVETLSYNLDEKNEYNIDNILLSDSYTDFKKSKSQNISISHSKSALWIKIDYKLTSENELYILKINYPYLDYVDIIYKNRFGVVINQSNGLSVNLSDKEIKSGIPIFELKELNSSGTIFVRIKSESGLVAPISIYEKEEFYEENIIESGLEFAFAGWMIGVGTLNLFLFLLLRSKANFYYFIYCIAITSYVSCMNGSLFHYAVTESYKMRRYSVYLFIFISAISVIKFTLHFIDKKKLSKSIQNLGKCILTIWSCLAIIGFLLPYYEYTTLIAVCVPLTALLLISIGVISFYQGFQSAKIYLLSWGVVLISVSYQSFLVLGFIEGYHYSFFVIKIGICFESIMLAVAMSSKIKELQEEKELTFQQLIDESMKNLVLKDEFLANTSHELKTPLHGISGISESLLDGDVGSITPDVKSNIRLIQICSNRLSILIDDILDFSKIKEGEINLNIREVDIHSVVTHVLKLLENDIKSKDINILNQISNDDPYLICDENRLHQIFFNLIGNSLKFTNSGFISIKSELIEMNLMKISISDTGVGVMENDLSRIFESFIQAPNNSGISNTGSGLGLAIVKKLIELQSGKIEVKSTKGLGSTFSFILPCKEKVKIFPNQITSESSTITNELNNFRYSIFSRIEEFNSKSSTKRVLIVDDEEINLQIVLNFLNKKEYSVDVSFDGKDALEKVSKNTYDLVLLDVMMPHISGYEVCREIRKVFNKTELPILLLSARNQTLDMTIGLSSGANDFLTKPFDKSELMARIQNLLEMKAAIKEISSINEELKNTIHIANTDELTGINNRRCFFKLSKLEWEDCNSRDISFSILMMDIDNFKKLNDRYGHEAGDLFLKKASEAIHFSVRESDIIGRIGGEEFAVFLKDANFDTAIFIAERIRRNVDDIELFLNGAGPIRSTISIGLSTKKETIQSFEGHMREADELLYQAKNKGRNRIQFLTFV